MLADVWCALHDHDEEHRASNYVSNTTDGHVAMYTCYTELTQSVNDEAKLFTMEMPLCKWRTVSISQVPYTHGPKEDKKYNLRNVELFHSAEREYG